MAVELRIPQAGESISEVQIADWRKSEGEHVDQDEIVVEIETDKASMELPSPSSGTLARIMKRKGETVHVGDVIAVIEESGEGAKPAAQESAEPESQGPEEQETAKAAARESTKPAGKPRAVPASEKSAPPQRPAGPQPARPAAAAKPRDEAAPRKVPVEAIADREGVEPRVMPAAGRVMAEHGLKPTDVQGTGPGGRILKEDVVRQVEESEAGPAKPPEPILAGDDRHEEVIPMSMIRRRIAQRLVEAQQTAALLTTFNEIDMTAILALRKQHQDAFLSRYQIKLGFMSFFVKAAVEALKQIPQVNAEVRGTDIVYRNYYDIGIAVGGGKGLVVPIIRNAERLSFAQIEQAIADFAARARENKIKLEELAGGTFTISNGGIYGSLLSTPIVNPPQSGILGLHAIQDRPVARDGQVVIRPMMYVALTYDHRVVDGREAVTFLRRIKEAVEDPSRILLEV